MAFAGAQTAWATTAEAPREAGEVTAVSVSDTSLFSASNETGEWIVTAHQAMDTAFRVCIHQQ
jgi:hypothetical protein